MTDNEIRESWRRAKIAQLESGYATGADRRIAANLRSRRHRLTAEQIKFCEMVERCNITIDNERN